MVGLGDLPGTPFYSVANGVSADGAVVVGFGSRSASEHEAFRWTQAGGLVGLGDLPGGLSNSNAYGVSAERRSSREHARSSAAQQLHDAFAN